jgi:hypothetical protein
MSKNTFNTTYLKMALTGLMTLAGMIFLQLLVPVQADVLTAKRFYHQGLEAHQKGKSTQAIQFFEQAVLEDPQMVDAHFNLASLFYKQKNYDKARLAFYQVTLLNPTDSQAKYHLAVTLEKMGRFEPALAYYEQVTPDSQFYQISQARAHEVRPLANLAKQSKSQVKPQTADNTANQNSTQNSTERQSGWRPVWMRGRDVKTETQARTTTVIPAGKPIDSTARLAVETYAKGFSGPTGMAMAGDGRLYVANYSENSIFLVSNGGNKQTFYEGNGLNGPLGLTVDPRNGVVYVANYLDNNVVKISPTGVLSVVATGLHQPYYMTLDPTRGILYVSEKQTNTVSKIQLNP